MKFAHMADLHLGGWRDPKLERLSRGAFERALKICGEEKVDFIIISGDLFDTSMPAFDVLEFASARLAEARGAGMPVYTISGSHDYSPSGKTILKVLENAGLIVNVARGEEKGGRLRLKLTDDGSGARLTGMVGKKGGLEEQYYRRLDSSVGEEDGYKIFLLHSGIRDFLPGYLKDAEAIPLSLLPEGFDYYAAGHIHHRSEHELGKGTIVFPGPLFPTSFRELERFGSGGFYIIEDGRPRFVGLGEREVVSLRADAGGRTAKDVEAELEDSIARIEKDGFILLIRAEGTLREGRPADIDFRRLSKEASERGAYAVRRNTSALSSEEY